MRKFKKSLAHGQVPIDFLLARSKKSLAPGVGQSDLSAPDKIKQIGNNLISKTDKDICYDLHIDLVYGHCMPLTKQLCLSKVLAK